MNCNSPISISIVLQQHVLIAKQIPCQGSYENTYWHGDILQANDIIFNITNIAGVWPRATKTKTSVIQFVHVAVNDFISLKKTILAGKLIGSGIGQPTQGSKLLSVRSCQSCDKWRKNDARSLVGVSEWVSEQFLNGTSAHYRLSSAIKARWEYKLLLKLFHGSWTLSRTTWVNWYYTMSQKKETLYSCPYLR